MSTVSRLRSVLEGQSNRMISRCRSTGSGNRRGNRDNLSRVPTGDNVHCSRGAESGGGPPLGVILLICRVSSNSLGRKVYRIYVLLQVKWYKNGDTVAKNAKIRTSILGNKHTLTITNVNEHDFGSYTCHASNSLGRNQKAIVLSGEMNQPPGIRQLPRRVVTIPVPFFFQVPRPSRKLD